MSSRVALGLGAALVVAAAALFLWGRPLNAIDLPTSGEPEGVGNQALYEGKVLGEVKSGCLTLDNGTVIVWPMGYYALDDPARVMRPNGDVAVTVGQLTSLGGGFGGSAPRECGAGGTWTVSEVESAKRGPGLAP